MHVPCGPPHSLIMKKGRAISDPAPDIDDIQTYFLNFLLTAERPASPVPSNQNAPGRGTGLP